MSAVILPSVCDRAAAETVYAELADALSSQPIEVDASQVTKIGQAALQVLVSAAKSEGGIKLNAPSKVLSATIEQFGLAPTLLKDESV